MWKIDKQFSFCYGHRVWSQKLNGDFCEKGDTSCKCRHLHGHEGLVHVFLESNTLERGMVTDFKHLGWLQNFLDDNVDHKFIIDQNDPMFFSMVEWPWKEANPTLAPVRYTDVYVPGTNHLVGRTLDLTPTEPGTPKYEVLEGFFIVDFVPTSENLSKWLFDAVKAKMDTIGVQCSQVDWYETPKSRSSYSI